MSAVPRMQEQVAVKPWPRALERPFQIVAFTWDGVAGADPREDGTPLRHRIERLLQLGVRIAVITDERFGFLDRQLSSAIVGPHKQRLYVLCDRGSTVYGFDAEGRPLVLERRLATEKEERILTSVAERVRDEIRARTGLPAGIVSTRLNRRRIELIPASERGTAPRSARREQNRLLDKQLQEAGLEGGIQDVVALAARVARESGLADARISSDDRYVEVALTDRSDSAAWVMRELAGQIALEQDGMPISPRSVLFVGDRFGPVAGRPGSDSLLQIPAARGAAFVSVGAEPGGVPAGVVHLGGGRERFRELLEDQIEQHERSIWGTVLGAHTYEPTWVVYQEDYDPVEERGVQARLTVGNGYVGTRGTIAESIHPAEPATLVAGVFDSVPPSAPIPELVVAPNWTVVRAAVADRELQLDQGEILAHRRTLDLRRGVLLSDWRHRDPTGRITRISSLRLASLANRRGLLQLTTLVPENYVGSVTLESIVEGLPPIGAVQHLAPVDAVATPAGLALVLRTLGSGLLLATAARSSLRVGRSTIAPTLAAATPERLIERWTWPAAPGRPARLTKVAAMATSRDALDPIDAALATLRRIERDGVTNQVREHVEAWQERWSAAGVEIAGSEADQRAIRFAAYHLISAANPDDESVSIGARTLSGPAYQGHVFWDTEIFVLPFFIHTDPLAARAMLMYRYRTLPAARDKARAEGYRGALFAWESAGTGEECTPPHVISPTGEKLRILTGEQEHHISADVAYGVWNYWQATGDDAFFLSAGAEIVLETARFWASRATQESDGRYHIRKVIGPDEYHEAVDDNAYTNGMARWNLQRGLDTAAWLRERWPRRWKDLAARLELDEAELRQWREVADGLVTGFDPATGLIEQFAGFFQLERINLADYEPRQVPMDVLLGRERTQRTQVLKQADVVMLLYLLWDEFTPEVRERNFRYYEPITGHGSSLSPAIHAAVAARLGDRELAARFFAQAADIDLGDTFGNTAGGVHAAALGGLWQAAIFGCAGLRLREDGLSITPTLLPNWRGLAFPIQWRGRRLRVAISAEPATIAVTLQSGPPMNVTLEGIVQELRSPGQTVRVRRGKDGWRVA